jgi:hypothetical protein
LGVSGDWFEEETGKEPEASKGEPSKELTTYNGSVVASKSKDDQLATCRELQNEVFNESLEVLQGALRFADLDDDGLANDEPPEDWIAEMGLKRARRAHRLARAASLPEKMAPAGIRVATNVMLGCLRAQAVEKQMPNTLNVAFVNMSVSEKKLPEMEVEGEEVKSVKKR